MYHDVTAPHADPPADDPYAVSRTTLAATLTLLREHGFVGLTLSDLLLPGGLPSSERAVVLTFDDARRGVLEHALPELSRHCFKGVVYAISGRSGQARFLNAEGLRSLAAAGWDVGSHGVTHRHLSGLPRAALDWEWQRSRGDLEDTLGRPVRHASLPGGRGGRREARAASRAGLVSLGTSVPGLWRCPLRPLAIPRFAVRSGHSPRLVLDLALGRWGPVSRERLRHGALGGAKALLGDRLYDRLRRTLTGAGAGEAG